MNLHGKQLIAGDVEAAGPARIEAVNPVSGDALAPPYHEATADEIDRAVQAAATAAPSLRNTDRAALLETIAEEIEALGATLVDRMMAETGLPEGRVVGERGRTMGQLRQFAALVREGSWVDARIDRAQPERSPIPKPDLRRMLVPIGPVAVFGASNFPLAFSVAGGDTASALAAGCPVVNKAHPAHPGTSELVGGAIVRAIARCGIDPGAFSMVHGARHETGLALVTHPGIRAVGFTGSLAGGRALFDAAGARDEPIPVFAEMGSTNPMFLLPGAIAARGAAIAEGLAQSVMLGSGQFCTNPGLVFAAEGAGLDSFLQTLAGAVNSARTATMLHGGIRDGYEAGVDRWTRAEGVASLARVQSDDERTARPAVCTTDLDTFLGNTDLHHEVFGPATLVVRCQHAQDLVRAAWALGGNLSGTIHADGSDEYEGLIEALQDRVGRIILNSFPTGVEVCPSMQHGGPYPATTDSRSTSVGTAAILRFARPVCWQGFPDVALPPELRRGNPRGILRMVDGTYSRDSA